jgi:hypothetical protein
LKKNQPIKTSEQKVQNNFPETQELFNKIKNSSTKQVSPQIEFKKTQQKSNLAELIKENKAKIGFLNKSSFNKELSSFNESNIGPQEIPNSERPKKCNFTQVYSSYEKSKEPYMKLDKVRNNLGILKNHSSKFKNDSFISNLRNKYKSGDITQKEYKGKTSKYILEKDTKEFKSNSKITSFFKVIGGQSPPITESIEDNIDPFPPAKRTKTVKLKLSLNETSLNDQKFNDNPSKTTRRNELKNFPNLKSRYY